MTIDSTTLEACKAYMRVDGDDDDSTITMMMESAAAYLDDAGVGDIGDSRYNHALYAMTLHYYDHRDDTGDATPLPSALRNLITQLKLNQAVAAGLGYSL